MVASRQAAPAIVDFNRTTIESTTPLIRRPSDSAPKPHSPGERGLCQLP